MTANRGRWLFFSSWSIKRKNEKNWVPLTAVSGNKMVHWPYQRPLVAAMLDFLKSYGLWYFYFVNNLLKKKRIKKFHCRNTTTVWLHDIGFKNNAELEKNILPFKIFQYTLSHDQLKLRPCFLPWVSKNRRYRILKGIIRLCDFFYIIEPRSLKFGRRI